VLLWTLGDDMLDTDAITRMIEKQITTTVNDQVVAVLTSDEWITPLEEKILQYTQARILNKFANSTTMPEIIAAVKDSVAKLFSEGNIPGIEQFIDLALIKTAVDRAIENFIQVAIEQFSQDPAWQSRVEALINQTIVHETVSRLGAIDLNPVIKQHVDAGMKKFTNSVLKNFTSTGIVDQANKCELIVMDDAVVVENCLTANSIEAVDSVRVKNLVVTGSINTDNESWSALASDISQRTLDQLTTEWNNDLVDQVVKQIQDHGIEFDQVLVNGEKIIDGNQLTRAVTESSLQSVGSLKTLTVRGEAKFNNDTLNVLNKRLGVNTDSPEKALGVWDEEVSIVIGKHKLNQAYIGTNREQSIAIGVNREPQLEITTDGLTRIKQLQVGLHKISHATQVPGWSGTRGDMVFNASPGPDRVFAWVCLGSYNWQVLKSAE
jgi:hypothetical protein